MMKTVLAGQSDVRDGSPASKGSGKKDTAVEPVKGGLGLEPKKNAIQARLKEHPTPFFLADRNVLLDRLATLRAALEARWPTCVISYSFKTNYLVAESRIFQEQGVWAEATSGWEYQLARTLGYAGDRIIFNGPWKTDRELQQALDNGSLLHVNDQEELNRILKLTASSGKMHPIGLRLSTTIPQFGHSRFGFSMDRGEASAAIKVVAGAKNLHLTGLHTHLHGDTDDPSCYRAVCRQMVALLAEQPPSIRDALEYLDLGGGFPAKTPKPHSRKTWNPRGIDEYVQAIVEELSAAFLAGRRPALIVEPGRYLVNDGISFVSRVVSLKQVESNRVITSNASLSMIPLTHYRPQVITAHSSDLVQRTGGEQPSIIHGASCRENDILFQGPFPAVETGDYLVHHGVGAYNSSMGSGFIFQPPPLLFI
jgi:diaminopimelate decarboxylase